MKQLTAAWTLYARDNGDTLTPLASGPFSGKQSIENTTWAGGWLDWNGTPDNTNTSFLVNPYGGSPNSSPEKFHFSGLLGYYARDPRLFVSPNEPSKEVSSGRIFSRTRSLSMNLTLKGNKKALNGNLQALVDQGYRVYSKMSDLAGAKPSSTFVLITEHPDTLADAQFVVDMTSNTAFERPSSLEGGGANLSFADGHVENWQWRGERFRLPVRFAGIDFEPLASSDEISDWNRVKAVTVSR